MRDYSWTVKFTVDPSWVADGFELTNDRAKDMIENAIPYSFGHETQAKVISAPSQKRIRKEQGYND